MALCSTRLSTRLGRRLGLVGLAALSLGVAACAPASPSVAGSSATSTGAGGDAGGGGAGGASVTTTSSSAGGSGGAGGEGGGVMTLCPPDADGDNLSDELEGEAQSVDTDGDGTPDALDLDSDDDSIPDAIEGQTSALGCATTQNSDGLDAPDFRDTDSDDNGLPDRDEVYPDGSAYDPQHAAPNPADTDGDEIPDYADPDNDGDALPDADELEEGVAVDTDGDGLPDLDDVDADGDTIADGFEQLADPDGDSVPAFRDLDSDDDGLSDECEAGPGHMLQDPTPDTDNDGKYDFLDLDSDADGIPDGDEDANHDCVLDDGETDPRSADTDGDGTSDFIEVELGSDPRDPLATPGKLGKYYFILPYQGDPAPTTNLVPLHTDLQKGDVAFVVDTTATMGGEIQNLKTGMSDVIQQLHAALPDLGVAVAGHDDFPVGSYGSQGVDQPFYVAGPTGYVSTSLGDNLGAVLALNVHDGGDFPESQIAAYYRALTDYFLTWGAGTMPPSGAPNGTFGSLHFRADALPIVVGVTDASFHNGRRASQPGTLHDAYDFNGAQPYPTPTVDDLVTTMNAIGARYIGISASNGTRNGGDPYEDMAYLTDQTGSDVPPSAFGGAQCGTGLLGTFIAPDGPPSDDAPGGTCRLVFDVNKDGTGVSSSVVSGVVALLKSLKLDVRPLASADPNDSLDAVDTFIDSIAVSASGGDDEAEPGSPCIALNAVQQLSDQWLGPKGIVHLQDGVNETARGVVPSQKICFTIVPKPNTSIPQDASPHVYHAVLTIRAKNGAAPTELVLGLPREIAFIVPPAPQ
jgi:hypothetical protein